MKELLLLISAVLVCVSLMILQLNIFKKHHPNAELLIGLLRKLNADQKMPGSQHNG